MPINVKHFTLLFFLLMILSTGAIIAIFKVESDTSSFGFIRGEQEKLIQESLLIHSSGKNCRDYFDTLSSFHSKAGSYLVDTMMNEIVRSKSASALNLILGKSERPKLSGDNGVVKTDTHILIYKRCAQDPSQIRMLVYDKKLMKKRNGKRFLFYYLLLVSTSLAMSLIYANLKEKQAKIREREEEFMRRLHEKNEELEKTNLAYLEAINSKNRFFSIIAHDLRNPFQVVLGYTGLLLENYENMTDSEVKEYFADIESATGQLMRLLDNLLLWSRSQTGSITMRPSRLDLQSLVQSTISLVQVNSGKKSVELISKIPPHCFVDADRDMVLTILRNLMTNAVKYTPPGGSVTVSAFPGTDSMLQISIKDTGIGMSRENMEKLFRTDTVYSHKGTNGEEGTGLGLMLCAGFVEKHGGKIWVESEQGEGSEFYFTLPHHPDSVKTSF